MVRRVCILKKHLKKQGGGIYRPSMTTPMFAKVPTRVRLNIAIIGLVSQGKSTLLNALLMDTFAKTEHKRSTMLPQVYISEAPSEAPSGRPSEAPSEAYAINEQHNLNAQQKRDKGTFCLDDCKEIFHSVSFDDSVFHDFIKSGVDLAIYDIPGINDGNTSVYREYLSRNITKFDIILHVVDIRQALNTMDDAMLLDDLTKVRSTTRIITVVNKCDDMRVGTDGLVTFEDQELVDCATQISSTVSQKFETITVVPISSIEAYVYRVLKKNPKARLDTKFIDRIISAELGSNKCKRMQEEEKRDIAASLISTINFEEAMSTCGMNVLLSHIKEYFNEWREMITDRVLLEAEKEMGKLNGKCRENLHLFRDIYMPTLRTCGLVQKERTWGLINDHSVHGVKYAFGVFSGQEKKPAGLRPFCVLKPMERSMVLPERVKWYVDMFTEIDELRSELCMDPIYPPELRGLTDYIKLCEMIGERGGKISANTALWLLDRVKEDHPIWSARSLWRDALLGDDLTPEMWMNCSHGLPVLLAEESVDTISYIVYRKRLAMVSKTEVHTAYEVEMEILAHGPLNMIALINFLQQRLKGYMNRSQKELAVLARYTQPGYTVWYTHLEGFLLEKIRGEH